MLCSVCLCINGHQLAIETRDGQPPKSISSSQSGFRHHDSIDGLIRAADDGCELCRAIQSQIKIHEAEDPLWFDMVAGGPIWMGCLPGMSGVAANGPGSTLLVYQLPVIQYDYGEVDTFGENISIMRAKSGENLGDDIRNKFTKTSFHILAKFSLYMAEASEESPPEEYCTSGRPILASSDTEYCFRLIAGWIYDCITRHQFCGAIYRADRASKIRPRRTLYVGPPDGSEEPRICEHDDGESFSWLALSHRWAGRSDHITTNANIAARKQQLPLSELPQTFQDAVYITRALNFKHIWIDSLCIIQDDPIDWATEAAKMADIYRQSYVTISANCSNGSDDGILKARDVKPDIAQLSLSTLDKTTSLTLHIRPLLKGWETNIESGNLNSRGWVLQEFFLAPRTVHFCEEQILFECRERRCSEADINVPGPTLPLGFTRWEISPYKQSTNPVLSKELWAAHGVSTLLHPRFNEEDAGYIQWYLMLVEYTARKLTFNNDKFPALAGLAKTFEEGLHDEYCAGLFKKDLVRGLLWQAHTDEAHKTVHVPGHAPSWSWAALDGGIEYDSMIFYRAFNDEDVYKAEIIDVSVLPSKEQKITQTSSGKVIIRGKCRALAEYHLIDSRENDLSCGVRLENPDQNLQPMSCFMDTKEDHVTIKEWYQDLKTNPEGNEVDQTKFAVLMLIGWELENWGNRSSLFMDGLILQNCSTGEKKQYKRVGWATLTDRLSDDEGFQGWTDWEVQTVEII